MRRFSTAMAVAFLVVSTAATPVFADAPEGPVHIALGDSVAGGSVANNPDVTGYVPRLNRWLRSVDCGDGPPAACPHLELSNYAVGGATSDDLLADQLPAAVAEIVARASDGNPDNDTVYITLTIGGNDIFGPVIAACAGGITQSCIDTVQAKFANYQSNLAETLVTLRTAAPDAQIAIMTYDNPLAACFLAELEPLADLVLEGGGPLPGGLNDIIRGVAGGVGGVSVVETFGLLAQNDFLGGEDCLHPDDSGHRKIAKAFLAELT